MSDMILDLKGLKCPLPGLRTDKALRDLAPGTKITVLATDGMSVIDIPHLLEKKGHRLVTIDHHDHVIHFHIERGANPLRDDA
jgi:tRNA 2-thiouridine synthesizing protein A